MTMRRQMQTIFSQEWIDLLPLLLNLTLTGGQHSLTSTTISLTKLSSLRVWARWYTLQ
jgi:hypothetical protein